MSDDKTNPPLPGSSYGGAPQGTSTSRTGMTGTGLTGTSLTSPGGHRMITAVTAGTRIMGTYEIEHLISKGGMGEVYRGRNIHTGDPVAIKIVLPHLAQEEMIVALFQKEAKVLGRLQHDAIVRYHVFTNDPEIGRPSLIMEFVEGTSMNDRMKQGPMSEEEVRVLLRRLASGLEKAHNVGVIHRDLSPDNVILEDGIVAHAKIIDFGIAKSSMKGDKTLLQGQFAGKFSFVAPEQLGAFGGEIDGRTDIYSLALMMVAACQGRVLNMGKSIVEAVRARNAVPDLSAIYPELRPLLEHMLEPNPANRPASMAAVIQLIDNPDQIPNRAEHQDEDEDPDRTRIVSASAIAAQAAALAQGSAPKGSLPKGSPKASAANEVYVGIPSNTPPVKKEEQKKSGNGGMIAALLVLLAVGGGAGGYFAGLFDGGEVIKKPPVAEQPTTVQTDQPGTGTTGEAAAKAAEEAAAKKAADEAAAATRTAAQQAAQKAADEAAAVAAATRTAEQEAARKAADEAAAAAAATKAADEEAARKAAAAAAANSSDPRANQLAWLNAYHADECVFLSPQPGTGVPLSIEGFGTSVAPFSALLAAYSAAHGVEPNIDVRVINPPQCPVIDYMNAIKATQAIPAALVLDSPTGVLKSGETMSGRIEGLAGRAVSLFLVNGVGGATNLKPWIARGSDGSVSFSFTVNLAAGAEPTPQLILAVVTGEPVTKLDAVPNGVTARALVPFMKNEIEKARQAPVAALRFFRVEN